jgi:itaconate CoA-transferase
MAGLWAHPQLKARNRWRDVDTPVGPMPALLPPGGLGDAEPHMDPIPDVGQHTRAILTDLGMDTGQIDALIERGIV